MCAELRRASRLVGANPRGPVARVSLAVRGCLRGLGASPGDSVVVALSGGADSLALAAAAIDSGTRMGLDVRTVTVDHGLRPDSGHEARAVAELARSLGAVPRVVGVDAAVGADGPEGNARAARMEALRREASGSPV
ncbi:tRNA(Ile)-lysidine synthase (tRNA(Ile)-lysidinesynthetase), partial [Actinomyces sp. oral taxon 178 str. F0338]